MIMIPSRALPPEVTQVAGLAEEFGVETGADPTIS